MKKLVLLSLLLQSILAVYSQHPEIQFDRISVQQGLSDHSINCITQDHRGFIWIGGSNGLYKYDGYDVTFFQEHPGCNKCPTFKSVYSLVVDKLGLLWILSNNGITLFDPEKEISTLIYPYSIDSLHVEYNHIPNILIDSEGNIWAPFHRKLIKISYQSNQKETLNGDILPSKRLIEVFTSEKNQSSFTKHEPGNLVTTLFEDSQGNIFAGCKSGLYVLLKGQHTFIRLDTGEGKKIQKPLHDIIAIAQIDKNSYWIATRTSLCLMTNAEAALYDNTPDTSTLLFEHKKIPENQVPLSLLVDRYKNCLLGTEQDIYKIIRDTNKDIRLELINSNENDPGYVGYSKLIRDIFEDRTGVIWTAQYYNGITRFDLNQ